MNGLIYAIVFCYGIIMGSAANALIDRLPKGKSWFKGRSECDKCHHQLKFGDLIPVFSYLYLKGKCGYCHSPIPVRNLIVEIITGLAFIVILGHSWSYSSLLLAGIAWVTVIIAFMDWETKLVSEAMVVIWGVLALLGNWGNLGNLGNWGGLLIGVGVIGGIWLVTRGRAMGEGDIEIAAVMGWWLGWANTPVALWLAFVLGSVVGVWKLAKKKSHLKDQIAFGPFLVLGSWIAYWWGEKIWAFIVK